MFRDSGIPLLICDGKSVMVILNIVCNDEKLGLDQISMAFLILVQMYKDCGMD